MDEIGTDEDRRKLLLYGASALGVVAVGATAYPFIASMEPSERALSGGAPIEVDISKLEPGDLTTVEWRGKPVWVLRRTPEMIRQLGADQDVLSDPDSKRSEQPPNCANPTRSERPDIFVAVAICTHLGCIPTYHPEGGVMPGHPQDAAFYCPCHGSMYDTAGRVVKNVPAPLNLEIPPYYFMSDARIVVGESKRAAPVEPVV